MSSAPGSSQPPPSAVLSLDADESGAGDAASSTPAQTVTLISKEGHRLQVARQALMASELCKTTLEGDKDATEIPLYHIEGAIVAKVIEYLTYHLSIPARKIDKPLLSNNMRDLVDKWDVTFIEGEGGATGASSAAAAATTAAAGTTSAAAAAAAASVGGSPPSSAPSAAAAAVTAAAAGAPSAAAQEMLFKLLLAANYLNIRSLLQLTCAKVASLMKGKTPDQIRAVFNIRNDYTQAEEEEVRKEYKDLIG